ncbi:MAG: alkaline phosphatase family protein [Pseudomonadota bacterium]
MKHFAINPIWITLGPILVINLGLLASYLIYQLWGRKKLSREYKGAKNEGSKMLSSSTREWWFWTTEPIVRLFVKLRMGPNTLTALGFFIACLAACFFAKGWFGYAGWTMIFGATFDIFDGRVARLTGSTSRSGAFFDAVMDRFGEGACFLGLAYYFRESFMLPVVIAALIGSTLVSYTKARGEGVGVDCKIGMMQRPERVVYMGVAAVFDPVMGIALTRWWTSPPPVLMMIAVGFIAIMTIATAIHRMIYIMNALDTADEREKESIPQIISKLSTPEGREKFWDHARYGYDRSRAAYSHVVLFVASAIDPATMRDMMQKGEMPNVARHIAERGSAKDAVSVFPSTLGPAAIPFVTGCFPGTCDIPGTRWFDRNVHPGRVLTMNRFRDYLGWGAHAMDFDLSKSVRTIYEYSRQAVNIFGALNRGCGLVRDPSFFRIHRLFAEASQPEEVEKVSAAAFYWFAKAARRETDFVFYRFSPALAFGPDGRNDENVREACRKIDLYVGKAVDTLKSQGMYESTALMLTCDHSCAHVRSTFNLDDFVSNRFKSLSPSPCLPAGRRRIKDWQDAQAIALVSGTSMAHLYVRNQSSWSAQTFFEEIEKLGLIGSLLEQEGVDILAGRSVEGGIVVQSRRGRAHILEDADGRITYMAKTGDPFGLTDMPQVLDSTRAFDLTVGSNYPDCILQALNLFRSQRTGDLVISTKDDIAIASDAQTAMGATHGSLASSHMLVPFMTSVPGDESTIRTSDVFAISLNLLGIEPEHTLDGTLPQDINWDVIASQAKQSQ